MENSNKKRFITTSSIVASSVKTEPTTLGMESLGVFLRKKRISQRIDLDKMVTDTRINKSFLEAIERNDFNYLPAETYVRIFLKTVSAYLSLDPEAILQRYINENKKNESTFDDQLDKKDQSIPSQWIIGIVFICVLALGITFIVTYIKNKNNDIYYLEPESTDIVQAPLQNQSGDLVQNLSNTPPLSKALSQKEESQKSDTLGNSGLGQGSFQITTQTLEETAAQSQNSSFEINSTATPAPPNDRSLLVGPDRFVLESGVGKKNVLQITCIKDSAWVWVKRKGRRNWSNIFHLNNSKVYASDDPIYLRCSKPPNIKIQLNDQTLEKLPTSSGYFVFSNGTLNSLSRVQWENMEMPE